MPKIKRKDVNKAVAIYLKKGKTIKKIDNISGMFLEFMRKDFKDFGKQI